MSKHKFVIRDGLFYVTTIVDTHGIPHVVEGTPGFHDRTLAEKWADRQANMAALVQAEEEADPKPDTEGAGETSTEAPEADTNASGDDGDQAVVPPVGEAGVTGQEPQVSTDG